MNITIIPILLLFELPIYDVFLQFLSGFDECLRVHVEIKLIGFVLPCVSSEISKTGIEQCNLNIDKHTIQFTHIQLLNCSCTSYNTRIITL